MSRRIKQGAEDLWPRQLELTPKLGLGTLLFFANRR
jgi:hypothetical protein